MSLGKVNLLSMALACCALMAVADSAQADNIAPNGTVIMGLADDLAGAGAILHSNGPATTEINDGISGTPGEAVVINGDGTAAATGNGTDTWAGAIPEVGKEFDFVGVEWAVPVDDVTQVTVQHFLANDGGWWGPTDVVAGGEALTVDDITAPTLQVTSDGSSWTDVATINDYVAVLTGNLRGTGFPDGDISAVATFDFAEQDGIVGIRLIENAAGNAGGDGNGFISAVEFTVEGTFIPEPATSALVGLAMLGSLAVRRRK